MASLRKVSLIIYYITVGKKKADEKSVGGGHLSLAQRSYLINHLHSNAIMTRGKLTKDFTREKYQKMWEDLAQKINSMGGASKEWPKWCKV